MNKSIQAALYCVASLIAAASNAQVYKCPDPANTRTIYSDRPCTGDGVQLERKRSQAEMEYDRQKAAAEYQKFQNDQRRETEREQAAQRPVYRAPQQANAMPNARSPECVKAQRDLEFATSSISGTEDSRARSVAAANRKVDLECLGAAKSANIRAAEAGAPKVEINNYGDQNPNRDDSRRWCSGGYCW